MRWLFLTFLFLSTAMTIQADTYVYVSMASEQKIQIFRFEPKAKDCLTPIDTLAVDGAPGSLAVDPTRKFLFASLRTTSTLASFAIDPSSGKLKHLSTAALGKAENAAFVGTDRTGRWLISASYMGGKVVVHELDGGVIKSPAVQTVKTAPTAHAFVTDPDNRWVFVPHVAPNAIFQFKFDARTGKLTEAGKAAGGTAKAGPRHLAWHPKLAMAYSSDEEGNSITAYRFDANTGLRPEHTVTTLPAGFKEKNTTAEVKIHPSGQFALVSNRGHDSLAYFGIDSETGKLSGHLHTPTEKTPRSFEFDPDGLHVFGAGEGSGKLAVFSIDLEKGILTRVHTYEVGKSLTWVMAVKLGAK